MKKLVFVVLVLALMATGSYAAFGLVARQQVATLADDIQAQIPDIVDKEISAGLNSSQVYLKIPLPMSRLGEPDIEANLIVEQNVHHGPFVLAEGAPRLPMKAYSQGKVHLEIVGLEIPPPLQQLLSADLTITMPLVGKDSLELQGAPLQHSFALLGDSFNCHWQGFQLAMTFPGSSLLTYGLDLAIPGFELTGGGGDILAFRSLTATGEMDESAGGLSVGSMASSLDSLEVRIMESDDHLLAEGLSATVHSSEEADRWSMSEEMALKVLRFDDKEFSDLKLRLALRNLVASKVAAISQAFQELEADPAAQNDPQLAEQRSIAILMEHGPAALAASPEIILEELSAVTPHGQVNLKAQVKLNGEGELLLNPFFLLGRLSAEGSLQADKTALEQLVKEGLRAQLCNDQYDQACAQQALEMGQAQLADMVASNLLLDEGERYRSQAQYKEGQVLVNGAPLSLPLGQVGP